MQGLIIDSVTKQFNQQAILNGVFFNCKISEVVGLLGRNGSGKSTLLKIIFGTVNADFKHLKLDDKLISKGYLSRNISYLPQDNFIPINLSVLQAIEIFCNTHRNDLLNIQFVADNLQTKFKDFSGGERRLLEALIIIYSDAEYVLLDEPFSQLAPLLVDELKQHINKIKSFKGFIITDHYYQSILDTSDRIILLHNGCNYQIQNTDDLILHGYLPDFRE
ncbi:ATP-binding cassette domain-containing protein [Pedobacter jejuensis]|uniref:ATP-binding cassette domain-containing protein n=1 Tax=Pedobacter jejuensis TaxID=1268550 RepID=A0A3N0C1S2_9SPHI|nr:ATP-binding cassette domain-containing protein [Pedobacter jejuensis]RNL55698.1 ATP-binding cassette domain-containing protein [Pedobacter jejuensis]